jgi:TonB family protein
MAQKNKLLKNNFIIYTILSLLLHTLIIFLFLPDKQINKKIVKNTKRFSIKLKKKKKTVKKEKKKEKDIKNKQIVDIAKPNINKEPDKAKYLAKYDSKTKKETKAVRAQNIEPLQKNKKVEVKAQNIEPIQKNKKVEVKAQNIEPIQKNKKVEVKAQNIEPIQKNKKVEVKAQNIEPIQKQASKEVKLNFSYLQFSNMLNSASNDYLKDVKEGDYTDLNTLAYEYTGYFMKIKNKVSKTWNPAGAYEKYDPFRKIYGIKDRYTILLITIDKKGYLKNIKIQKSSGLSFLDNEAIGAFEKAQPYNIVPDGLLKGKEDFTIQFGFYVDNPSSPRVFYFR